MWFSETTIHKKESEYLGEPHAGPPFFYARLLRSGLDGL